jgi:hypothetical protein
MRIHHLLAVSAVAIFGLAACGGDKSDMEKAQDSAQEAMEEAGEAMEHTGDAMRKGAEDMKRDAEEAMQEDEGSGSGGY